jgi:uncharacterized protein (TIRG00374 family)
MRQKWPHRMRLWLGIVVSVVALYLAVRDVQWSAVGAALSKADAGFLFLALGSVLLNTLAKALRWRLLFYPRHLELTVKDCLLVLLAGQLANNLLPARSGDFLRALLIGTGRNISKARALATVVVEKSIDSVMLLSLVALLSLRVPMPQWLRQSSLTASSILAVVLAIVMLVASQRERIVAALQSSSQRHPWLAPLRMLRRLAEASGELGALRDMRVQAQLWAASVLIWGLAALTNTLTFAALALDVDPLASPLLVVVLMAGAIVPTSPLQLGVFDYLCVLALSLFGVSQNAALSYAFVLHVIVYLPIVVGGLLAIWLGPWLADWRALFEA